MKLRRGTKVWNVKKSTVHTISKACNKEGTLYSVKESTQNYSGSELIRLRLPDAETSRLCRNLRPEFTKAGVGAYPQRSPYHLIDTREFDAIGSGRESILNQIKVDGYVAWESTLKIGSAMSAVIHAEDSPSSKVTQIEEILTTGLFGSVYEENGKDELIKAIAEVLGLKVTYE